MKDGLVCARDDAKESIVLALELAQLPSLLLGRDRKREVGDGDTHVCEDDTNFVVRTSRDELARAKGLLLDPIQLLFEPLHWM